MLTLSYDLFFAISFLLSAIYVLIWRKHFDVNITAIFIIVPIADLGYVITSKATTEQELLIGTMITYIGGCYLTYFLTLCVLNICEISVFKRRLFRILGFLCSSAVFWCVLTMGKNKLLYESYKVNFTSAGPVFIKIYGPMHAFFYILLLAYLVIGLTAIIYTHVKNKQVSNFILKLLFFPELFSVIAFFANILLGRILEFTPLSYILAEIIYIIIVRRMTLYNVSDMVIDSMVQTGDTGFISFDFKYHYLGANETAKEILPELKNLSVDKSVKNIPWLEKNVNHWIEHFEDDNSTVKHLYVKNDLKNSDDDKMYIVDTNYMYDGNKKCGYRIFLTDDTKNQKYIKLLDKYNEELEAEVKEKTRHIVEMHDNLILSMATMVESRDNSTGGHIRRTSEVVRILIDEIRKSDTFELSDEFCEDIIKAAPMHDLGKVAVDDAILRKPGRFTPEEFEVMKTHAAEGARIVHEILKDTDDDSFKVIAENVAHYHHERMDGSGYPEGLKGEQIPLEARIMAIADVYDALVSKRVYKDSMSFEQADKIMMESMGKHFDKRLETFYVSARPKLEEYYSSLEK